MDGANVMGQSIHEGLMENRASYKGNELLTVIGAPSSAAAYGPGQEKAPGALRAAGLVRNLLKRGIRCEDQGDVAGYRWRVDKANPKAMNFDKVALVAEVLAKRVGAALDSGSKALILGGDCSVELGTFAGAAESGKKVGLVYIDLDTDLNIPESTGEDAGALDWMGVAHMLNIEGVIPELAGFAGRVPLANSSQIMFFSNDNSLPFERNIIEKMGISEVPFEQVVLDPVKAATSVVDGWAKSFDRLLIHVDLDVLNANDLPLAENCRKKGLLFDQLLSVLDVFLRSPNWVALTLTELNPYHGEEDGSTLRKFVDKLVNVIAVAFER